MEALRLFVTVGHVSAVVMISGVWFEMLYSEESVLTGVIMVLSDAAGSVQPGYYGDEEKRMGWSSLVIKKAGLSWSQDKCGLQARIESALACAVARVKK